MEYLRCLSELVERAQLRRQRRASPPYPQPAQLSPQTSYLGGLPLEGRTTGTTSHRPSLYSFLGSKTLNPASTPRLSSQGDSESGRGDLPRSHVLDSGRSALEYCDVDSPAAGPASIPRDTLFYPTRNELSWLSVLTEMSSRQRFDE